MFDRLRKIAEKMEAKLNDEKYINDSQKHKQIKDKDFQSLWAVKGPNLEILANTRKNFNLDEFKKEFDKKGVEFQGRPYDYYYDLLKVACKYNMQSELDELITAKNFDIDQIVGIDRRDSPETLLGIAAYHGHLDLVKYLVEKKSADVNAVANPSGDTALHRVVCGDSHPIHRESFGREHAAVAEYLIQHGADITITNTRLPEQTPLQVAQEQAPTWWETIFGRNYSRLYLADKVRPILEAEELALKNNPQKKKELAMGNKTIESKDIQSVNIRGFCSDKSSRVMYQPTIINKNGTTEILPSIQHDRLKTIATKYRLFLDEETQANLSWWLESEKFSSPKKQRILEKQKDESKEPGFDREKQAKDRNRFFEPSKTSVAAAQVSPMENGYNLRRGHGSKRKR